MNTLLKVIQMSGDTKQGFADKTRIPYYRVAMVLYGQDVLTQTERDKITQVFGENIFLPQTKRNV